MHDEHIQELALGEDDWNSHPLAWRNFVMWVICTHGLRGTSQYAILDCLKIELANWNLTLTDRIVKGTRTDLTAWMLTYS
jgi:hypothetical protein